MIFISCTGNQSHNINLPYTIVTEHNQLHYFIYKGNQKKDFLLKHGPESSQNILELLHNEDLLILEEDSTGYFGTYYYDKLYLVDFDKTIIDTIYSSEISKREIISGAFISPNDSLLLIEITYSPTKKNGEGWFYSPFDFVLMDFKNKKIIERLDSFYVYNIHYSNSSLYAFSPDSKNIVYSISNTRNWFTEKPVIYDSPKAKKNGIYIYNFATKQHERISDFGENPIWSPNGKTIAYFTSHEIWFYDLNSKTKSLFYKLKDKFSISSILWTPDNNYLYLLRREESFFIEGGILNQILIDIETKKEYTGGSLDSLGIFFKWK